MNEVILLGHGKPYDFKNDAGERISGVKVSYVNAQESNIPGQRGFLPLQLSLDTKILEQITIIPGLYEAEYITKPGRNNRPELVINGFKYISPVKFEF